MNEANYDSHFEKPVQGAVIGEHNTVTIINQERPEPPLSKQERLNRSRMLRRVSSTWIKGVLEQSLHNATLIALGLQEKSSVLSNPWRLVVQEVEQPTRPLSAGTRILQVYDDAGGELLILGEPGAGKTTLLLELTRDLLARSQANASEPLPVVFNLSSWAKKRLPLTEWLVEELHDKYDVQHQIGNTWVRNDDLLLLLDGLDEVTPSVREACIDAINLYRQEHSLVPVVVCCRNMEYLHQQTQLRLQKAVVIQPLTNEQIDDYLVSIGTQVDALRRALRNDPDLQELATTPLMLSILTLAYQDTSLGEITALSSLSSKRQQVFATYVQRMLTRRSLVQQYTPQRIIHWLSWLAQRLKQQNQTVFYLERMQPDWLPNAKTRQRYIFSVVGLVFGLIGLLAFGLIGWSMFPVNNFSSILYRLLFGTISGMLIGFLNGWLYAQDTPRQSNKSAAWPWQRLRLPSVTKILLNGLLTGLLIGLFYELVTAPQMGYTSSNFLTVGGNSALVGALIFVLFDRLLAIETTEIVPAEVFGWSWRRAAHGLVKFLFLGLFGSLLVLLLVYSSSGLYGLYWWYMHATDTILLTLQQDWWISLSYLLLIALMVGLLGALAGGLSSNVLDERNHTKPNQGIYRSARHSLFVGLGEGIAGGLMLVILFGILVYLTTSPPPHGPKTFPQAAIPVMLVLGLIFALFVGLISGLRGGGLACVMHLNLRVFLWHAGSLPWKYAHFLDYAAERILLRKVGGGYIFVHRLLLEYFAALESEQMPQTSVAREQQAHLPAHSPLQDKDLVVQSEALSNQQGMSRRKVLSSAASVGIAVIGSGFILQYFRPHPLYVYRGHVSQGDAYGVNAVAWLPNGRRIASVGSDNTVQVWDATDGGHLYVYRGHTDIVRRVAWSPNGERIASAGSDNTVQVWDAVDGGHVYIYRGHGSRGDIYGVNAVAWSPDGMRIASAGSDNTVQVWDAANGGHVYIYRGHSSQGDPYGVSAVAWSPDGMRIASAGSDNTVQVWDAADGGHAYIYHGHGSQGNVYEGVYAVAWSSDGMRIASAGSDNRLSSNTGFSTVQVWNAVNGARFYTYKSKSYNIGGSALAWSPDGKRLAASSGENNMVQLLDAVKGNVISTLWGAIDTATVAWSSNGKCIASGNYHGLVLIWSAE